MDYVQYSVRMEEFIAVSIPFDPEVDFVEKVEISKHENGINDQNLYQIKFCLNNVNDAEEAQQVTADLLQNLLNVLAFQYNNVRIHKPFLDETSINGNRVVYGSFTDTIKIKSHLSVNTGDPSEELKKSLRDKNLVSLLLTNVHFQLYKSAMELNDPFARYMFLYSILLLLFERQRDVESFIIYQIPNVQMIERTKTSGDREITTIFTALRNSVGHVTGDIELKNIIAEMELYVGQLSGLVKTAIFKNSNP